MEQYRNKTKLQMLSGEISWSHNVLIFQQCNDDFGHEFYINSQTLPGYLKTLLPSPEEISKKLEGLYDVEELND